MVTMASSCRYLASSYKETADFAYILNNATNEKDMNAQVRRIHALSEVLSGHWSVSVSGNWRVTFKFIGEDIELVNYQDYH